MTEVSLYVEEHIGDFHKSKIKSLEKLSLKQVLKRKNPYLFKAKNIHTADTIIRGIVDAHISSSEETLFGDWLEEFAIFINRKVYDGRKSGIKGIDLEFDNGNIRYIVSIKSGPHWANSSQIIHLVDYFKTAKKTLRTSKSKLNIISVNGCCYGTDNKPDKGDYYKYCGQQFWEFISGNRNLYKDIIEPLGFMAKEKNDEFNLLYSKVINNFIKEFILDFCNEKGEINWDKLIEFNSKSKFIE